MAPRRRTLLQVAGTTIASGLAGCSSVLPSDPTPPAIESKHVELVDGRCIGVESGTMTATVSYDRAAHELQMEGTFTTASPCPELSIVEETGVGKADYADDSVHLTVDPATEGDCERCPSEITYSGSVAFEHDPSAVHIYHVQKQGDQWKRFGPVTSKPID